MSGTGESYTRSSMFVVGLMVAVVIIIIVVLKLLGF
jgi:hypothetical protein